MSEKNEKDDSLEGYTSQVIRGPERSVRAMILAEHMILSVTTTPLKSVLHIAQAASMFSEDDLKKLEIDPDEIDILLTMAMTIDEAAQYSQWHEGTPDTYSIIVHNMDFDKYFTPWVKSPYFPHRTLTEKEASKGYTEAIKRANEGGDTDHAIAYSLRMLMPSGYNLLKTEFCRWATPKAQRMAEKISSQVDAGTYGDVLKLLQKPVEASR